MIISSGVLLSSALQRQKIISHYWTFVRPKFDPPHPPIRSQTTSPIPEIRSGYSIYSLPRRTLFPVTKTKAHPHRRAQTQGRISPMSCATTSSSPPPAKALIRRGYGNGSYGGYRWLRTNEAADDCHNRHNHPSSTTPHSRAARTPRAGWPSGHMRGRQYAHIHKTHPRTIHP